MPASPCQSGMSTKTLTAAAITGTDTYMSIAIYHTVRPEDTFDEAAEILFQLVRKVKESHPGEARVLYLDIEGHRNDAGGFDHDMHELQRHFIGDFLAEYVSGVRSPLASFDKPGQSDDMPEALTIEA
jgi:hypothetical protein